MLTAEENERLTRVGWGTPMGSWCEGFGFRSYGCRTLLNPTARRCVSLFLGSNW
jgi:hypothetical protein